MKHKQLLMSINISAITAIAFSAIIVASGTNLKKEKDFHGIKATPFAYRYPTDDIAKEPSFNQSFNFNFQHMGIGKPSATQTSVWHDNRGETETNEKVVVAVIDSGINIYHEDFLKPEAKGVKLTSKNIETYSTLNPNSCFIHDPTNNGQYESDVVVEKGILNAYDVDIYDPNYNEYYSHGTASSACIAAAVNGMGGVGIAPNVSLMMIRMDFWFNSLSKSIKYAVDNGASVINMSLGAYSETFRDGYGDKQKGVASTATALEDAISYATSHDVVVVAAAGNEKTNHKSYPACNNNVVGVGALERQSGTVNADFSNFNKTSDTANTNNNVDVMAPGYVYTANVPQIDPRTSTTPAKVADSTMAETQGTSFASPLTAGAIALYRAKYPNINRVDVIKALENSCDDIGTSGWDSQYGYGRVNVAKFLDGGDAVTEVNITPNPVNLVISPSHKNPTAQLTANFLPATAGASHKTGIWDTNDPNVCTVDTDTGLVTAVGVGTTQVGFLTELDMIEGYTTVNVTQSDVDPTPVEPDPGTESKQSITITRASINASDNPTGNQKGSYKWCGWTENNIQGKAFIYNENQTALQMNTNKNRMHHLYNTTAIPGQITNITIKSSKNTPSFEVFTKATAFTNAAPTGGTSHGAKAVSTTGVSYPITNTNNKYFCINLTSSGAAYLESIKIDYVTNATPTISLDKANLNVEVGETATLVATSNGTVTWESSNTKVATVNNGVVKGISVGSATITAKNGTAKATCAVTVTKTPKVSLDKSQLTIELNESAKLVATANGPVSWESSNISVASVDNNGLISAKAVGSATITARNESASATCQVTVVKTPKISLNKASLTLEMEQTFTLVATANGPVTWESSNSTICSVDNNGNLRALKDGSAIITARNDTASATCDVTVTPNYSLVGIVINQNALPKTVPFKSVFTLKEVDVTANYTNNQASKTVKATLSALDTSFIGPQNITATYTENGVTKTDVASIFVTNEGATRSEVPSTGGVINTISSNQNHFGKNNQTMSSNDTPSSITWHLNCAGTPYLGYEGSSNLAAQIGSGGQSPDPTEIYTDSIPNETITKIVVTAGKTNAALSVSVGGVSFKSNNATSVTLAKKAQEFTFEGVGKGKISINFVGGSGNIYFRSADVYKGAEPSYSWSGDEQATSFVRYLKTFGSCSSSWSNRDDIPVLVNEYNTMIQDAKSSQILNETFVDNGNYTTTATKKMQMIVKEYNNSLKASETELTLDGIAPLQTKVNYQNNNENTSLIIAMIISCFVVAAPLAIIYSRKRKERN